MVYDSSSYSSTSGFIETLKNQFNIDKPNHEMTDEEIRKIIRFVGDRAPDTVWVDGKPQHGRQGIEIMIFLALTEFPEFYAKYELAQFN